MGLTGNYIYVSTEYIVPIFRCVLGGNLPSALLARLGVLAAALHQQTYVPGYGAFRFKRGDPPPHFEPASFQLASPRKLSE